ncbi:MAG: hypothetical protein QM744_05355 [Mesorhizobium sp.]
MKAVSNNAATMDFQGGGCIAARLDDVMLSKCHKGGRNHSRKNVFF